MRKADLVFYKLAQQNVAQIMGQNRALNNNPEKVTNTANTNNQGAAKNIQQNQNPPAKPPEPTELETKTNAPTIPEVPENKGNQIPEIPEIPEMPEMPKTPEDPNKNTKKTSYEYSFKTKGFDDAKAKVESTMGMSFEDRMKAFKEQQKTSSFKFIDVINNL